MKQNEKVIRVKTKMKEQLNEYYDMQNLYKIPKIEEKLKQYENEIEELWREKADAHEVESISTKPKR